MDKRLSFIDMARGIGIILVLLGHLEYTYPKVLIWISSFHMPLFFVLAGITLSLSDRREHGLKESLGRKCRTILIPYAWFSLLYFVIDIGNLMLHKIDRHTFTVNAISSLSFYGKSVMWFMTALFISEAVLLLLIHGTKRVSLTVVVIAVLSCAAAVGLNRLYEIYEASLLLTTLINILKTVVRAGIVLPFVTVGYMVTELYRDMTEGLKRLTDNRLLRPAAGLLLLILNIVMALCNGSVDTNNMILMNPVLYYLAGLTGSLAVICICAAIPRIGLLERIGRYSLVIMAIHLDMYVLWAGLQVGKLVFRYIPYLSVLVAVTVTVTLILGSAAAYLTDRYFPFILGRRRVKQV